MRWMARCALVAGLALGASALLAGGGGSSSPPGRVASEASASAPPGLRVWAAQGCGSCHALSAAGATGAFGPDLDASLRGRSAGFVRASIVAPSANGAPDAYGVPMPDYYGRRIGGVDLDRLVRFVMAEPREGGA